MDSKFTDVRREKDLQSGPKVELPPERSGRGRRAAARVRQRLNIPIKNWEMAEK